MSEVLTCPICDGQIMNLAFHTKDYFRHTSERTFDIHRCQQCGLGRTLPLLEGEELSHAYPIVYYQIDENLKLEHHPLSRKFRLDRIDALRRHSAGKRLLDVGANTGMFVKTAKEEGFDAEGVEISADAVNFGRTTWDLPLHLGTLDTFEPTAGEYDAVTLWHVWEHLPDPRGAAASAIRLLRSGGLLALAVPNFGSLQARAFGSRWFHLDVPRHLFHYTPEAMSRLLRAAGFQDIDVRFGSPQHDWAGILGSMMNLDPPQESIVHKSLRKLIGTPVARALALAEARLAQGGTFELYARKSVSA